MPKASGKHMKNKDSNNAARLLRQWQAAVAPLDRFTNTAFENVWRAVKFAVADAIASAADDACAAGLPTHDEALYDVYRRLMDGYTSVLALREDSPVADPRTKGLLDGVFALVQARAALGLPAASANPIAAEKKAIAVAEVKRAVGLLDAVGKRIRMDRMPALTFLVREAVWVDTDPSDALLARLFALPVEEECALHTIYESGASALWKTLHDFRTRHTAKDYAERLRAEHTVLTSAAQAHADMLHDAAENAEPPVQVYLQRVSITLKDVFTTLDADWTVLSPMLSTENMPEAHCLTVAELLDKCRIQVAEAPRPSFTDAMEAYALRIPYFRQTLSSALDESITHGAACTNQNHTLAEYRRMLAGQDALAEEVIHVFRRIHEEYEANMAQLRNAELADITHGIAETIGIKLDSLAESRAAFTQEADTLLTQFALAAEAPMFDDDLRNTILADGKKLVMTGLLHSTRYTKLSAVQEALAACEVHESLIIKRDAWIRLWSRNTETFQKKLTGFLKLHLLFECSTFEEILHYSVSRLRQADDPAVLAFAAAIDANAAQLSGIFTTHGIALIAPEPHDLFNGREHEVLMAEVHEDYKKGEIIKLMNCGYRQGDTILLRANVIAAK